MIVDHILTWVREYVQKEMEWVCSAHDFFHIERVVKLATQLQILEWNWDLLVIQLGAYLHESLDEKFFWDLDKEKKIAKLTAYLSELGLDQEKIDEIMFIVKNVWYGKSLERNDDFAYTIEFMIVEDADRLEAVWAIAIARTFAYGWWKWRPIYDPNNKPKELKNHNDYLNNENPSINHFYEKLLLLKDMMHTQSAKKIASKRHDYMQWFLNQFYQERDAKIT